MDPEMTMRRHLLGLVGVTGALLMVHCSSLPDACRGDACAASATDAGGEGGVSPPEGCDPSAEPKDAPKCVVNAFGIFVDATNGSDGNAGTKEAPLKTIAAALAKTAGKPRLYVCDGTYPEHVKLASPVSIFAGFACGAWTPSGNKAAVAPLDHGFALHVDAVRAPVVLADLTFAAKDATSPGDSSIAVFVSAASSVTFRRVVASAGKAADGVDASPLADFAPATAPAGNTGAAGGAQTPNPLCPSSIGGAAGKNGATSGANGLVAIAPAFPVTSTGAGGTSGGTCSAGGGTNGSYGLAGAAGAGAASWGSLSATGWKGTDGSSGLTGGDAQGGGGGAQINPDGVGGAGGPGGCGGAGGKPGTAGGSSIAILARDSSLAAFNLSLATANAGRGGNGAKGQKAQLGSATQAISSGLEACAGGFGGIGGSGGGGGAGAGGLSVGILYKGTPPAIDGASTPAADTLPSVTLGNKGPQGTKGDGGDAARTNSPASRAGEPASEAKPGEAKAILALP
jgi:Protein of unknown function (DUF1565)